MKIYAPLNSEPMPLLQKVEVAASFQLPSFHIVGLPAPEVAEAKERIRSALDASGIQFPKKRVVLNLSPASVKKSGTGMDLAMALAVLSIPKKNKKSQDRSVGGDIKVGASGELGLDGSVKPVGQLTRGLYAAWQNRVKYFFVSYEELDDANANLNKIRMSGEFSDISPPKIIPCRTLEEAAVFFNGLVGLSKDPNVGLTSLSDAMSEGKQPPLISDSRLSSLLPLAPSLERILGVAAAGRHHLLLLGPRGTGKTHALEWLTAIQPAPHAKEWLVQKLMEELWRSPNEHKSLWGHVPVHRVSSQVRPEALVGGAYSSRIRPGVFTLAHGGVLIADEFPEWARDSREAFREPLESRKVTLTRSLGAVELPASFVLAATGNLCPCGGRPPYLNPNILSDSGPRCRCTDLSQKNYLNRISGPLLDRIDLAVLLMQTLGENPAGIAESEGRGPGLKAKVQRVRESLMAQWGGSPGLLNPSEIEYIIRENSSLALGLTQAGYSSLRSRHKIVRIALTLAAWDDQAHPSEAHLIEAGMYRSERFLNDIE